MSKKQKTARSQKRKAAKRAEKAARRAHYEALRDARQNKKSKNKMRREGLSLVKNFSHQSGRCYNVGCHACFPADHNAPPHQQLLSKISNSEFKPGIPVDRQHMSDIVFKPKRYPTKPWGAPLTAAEYGPMNVGD
jgi:hypothetical protein